LMIGGLSSPFRPQASGLRTDRLVKTVFLIIGLRTLKQQYVFSW
jgi:hypothetical protein